MFRMFCLAAVLLVAASCTELEQLKGSVEFRESNENAEAAFKQDDFEGALAAWEEAFGLDPTSDETAFNISRCYARLGDEENALDWLRKSIKLALTPRLDDPDLGPLAKNEEFQQLKLLASFAYDKVPASKIGGMDDTSTEAWDTYLAGEYEKSAGLWEQIFRLDQSNERAAFNAACCHALQGNEGPALEWLRVALKSVLLRFLEDHDMDKIRGSAEFKRISETARKIWE
ncbi:MAG TPA: tetratricopeptide repeat protein [bacterium]|nr:tetratricopeptide repeat protein [bacterium]